MSRESDFYTVLHADTALNAILTGGIYQGGLVGEDGITRDFLNAMSALDTNGYPKPCALIKQRGRVPTSEVVDYGTQVVSTNQVVGIWLYEDSGYVNIDAAVSRLYTLLQGRILSGSFELSLANLLDRQRDTGALKGHSLGIMDFAVHSIMVPA